jgi:uncharacterized protein
MNTGILTTTKSLRQASEDLALVYASASSIHGAGLFAARAVVAGEVLCEYRGERITKAESRRRSESAPPGKPVYSVALDDDTDIDGDIPDNPAKFANHACEANSELTRDGDRLWLVAARDIPAGSEILFDYGFGLAESLAHPCRCGMSGCAGHILAAPLRPLLKKHLRRTRAR